MRIDEELAQFTPCPAEESVLTIGVFDGVHKGHQHLIDRLIREADAYGRLAGVVTFTNHPASVLRPGFTPQYITSLGERIRLIEKLGVDFVAPITFDLDVSRLSPREFIMTLREYLLMRGIVVGPDFAMGHNRKGDIRTIYALGEEIGFTTTEVRLFTHKEQAVRSSAIRHMLAEGSVSRAAKLLGRDFALEGTVVEGAKRGRTLGYPTANLQPPPDMIVPANGIYCARAVVGEDVHMAATSIGTRPTFDNGARAIEAYILDFSGDLYGKTLRLEFVERLRDELKFDSIEALLKQIERDVQQTRAILSVRPRTR
ncbi:MAG: bifunctional riboflavin kinase/FAD synthetase [Chloroflexi bacterium]|nr:bifunctional riboflavin kinase/FAD synthetase [Chloroflexota bacterium]